MKRVFPVEEHCIACKLCETWCAIEHSPSRMAHRYRIESPVPLISVQFAPDGQDSIAMQCRHCEDAPCVDTCIAGALMKVADGRVEYYEDRCVGCWMCIMSCPYGVIKPLYDKKKIRKCDLCPHLDTPACVTHCPTGALVFQETPPEFEHEPWVHEENPEDPLFVEG